MTDLSRRAFIGAAAAAAVAPAIPLPELEAEIVPFMPVPDMAAFAEAMGELLVYGSSIWHLACGSDAIHTSLPSPSWRALYGD